jgi:hypothetical protein
MENWDEIKLKLLDIENEESMKIIIHFIDNINSPEDLKKMYQNIDNIPLKAYILRSIYYRFQDIRFLEVELLKTQSEILQTTIIPFIRNEALLINFVEDENKNLWSKVFAIRNIADNSFLCKILLFSTSSVLTWTALHQLSDDEIIFNLIIENPNTLDEFVIKGLIKKLSKIDYLLQLKLLLGIPFQQNLKSRITQLDLDNH